MWDHFRPPVLINLPEVFSKWHAQPCTLEWQRQMLRERETEIKTVKKSIDSLYLPLAPHLRPLPGREQGFPSFCISYFRIFTILSFNNDNPNFY